jgi:hypothetical protein
VESMPTCAQHFILGLRTETRQCSIPSLWCPCLSVDSPTLQTPFCEPSDRWVYGSAIESLDLETLNLVLEGADLAHQVGGFVGGDRRRDDRTSNTTGAAKCHLAGHVNVRNVLVLAKQRQVEEDGERGGVGSENDQLADSAIQGLGCLVGTLLELAVVGGLLDEVKDLLGESLVGPKGGS